MSKFKVGDKVRFKDPTGHGDNRSVHGRTYVITSIDEELFVKAKDSETGIIIDCFASRFELYNESELERLVRIANEGADAAVIIETKYLDEIECVKFTDLPDDEDGCSVSIDKYRIKPKPKLEPFTVGNAWTVKLEGETLHIGCKKFKLKEISYALKQLTKHRNHEAYEFNASREGIFSRYDYDHVLPWADADRILAALEKAGIK